MIFIFMTVLLAITVFFYAVSEDNSNALKIVAGVFTAECILFWVTHSTKAMLAFAVVLAILVIVFDIAVEQNRAKL